MTEFKPEPPAEEPPLIPDQHTEPSPAIPYGWLRALLMLITLVLVLIVASLLMYLFLDVQALQAAEEMQVGSMLVAQLVTFAAMWFTVWLFRRFVDRRSMVSLGFSLEPPFKKDLVAGLLWGAGIISAVFLILWLVGALEVVSIGFPATTFVLGLLLFILVAVAEELVMRGYVLRNLMDSFNPYVALVISAIPFALGHALNPNASLAGIINIVFAGLVLGIYYIHRRNLWFPIGIHLAWNFCQGVVFGSPVSGQNMDSILQIRMTGHDLITGGKFGFEASVVSAIVILAATLVIHLQYKPVATGRSSTGQSEISVS